MLPVFSPVYEPSLRALVFLMFFVLFLLHCQPGRIEFNSKLLANTMDKVETLVKVGIPLGTAKKEI